MDKKEKPIVKPKEEYTPQQFAKAYQEICGRMGYRIVVTPVFLARDDNTWSVVLQTSVGKLPELVRQQ